jgi:hypothetical protein
MMDDYFLDNDLIIKLLRYGLIDELLAHCCSPERCRSTAVLATAQWVCRNALERAVERHGESTDVLRLFESFLAAAEVVEPTAAEVANAAALEDLASELSLPLDPGESILAAVVAARGGALLTGDKRAIIALEALVGRASQLGPLQGRVGALEQAMMTLAMHMSVEDVASGVQRAPAADTAMRLAFSPPPSIVGLLSYLEYLRGLAPQIMIRADSLCFEAVSYDRKNAA